MESIVARGPLFYFLHYGNGLLDTPFRVTSKQLLFGSEVAKPYFRGLVEQPRWGAKGKILAIKGFMAEVRYEEEVQNSFIPFTTWVDLLNPNNSPILGLNPNAQAFIPS